MLSVHLENGRVEVREIEPPVRAEGFAVIRLLYGGICNTDLELQRGYYGFAGTPGHEFVGEVIDCDSREWMGRRVVGDINLACRKCAVCLAGNHRHCPNRTVLGIVKHPGAFQEFFTLPECNLHAVPDDITNEVAVLTEPLAAACQILDQVNIPRGAPVAVLGAGKLGLLIARVLEVHGCVVHQFGRHSEKPPASFDWVVDATGSADGLSQAVSMTRPCGTVIMKSTVHGGVSIDTAAIIVNEITLVGSRCGRFEPALELLPHLDLADIISDSMPLASAPAAFERAAQKGVLKVLLTS